MFVFRFFVKIIILVTLDNNVYAVKTNFIDVINGMESLYTTINNESFLNITIPTQKFKTYSVTKKVIFSYDKREILPNNVCKYSNMSLSFLFDLKFILNPLIYHNILPLTNPQNISNLSLNITRENVLGVLTYSEMHFFEDEKGSYLYQPSSSSTNSSIFMCGDLHYYALFDYFDDVIAYDEIFRERFQELGNNVMKYVIDLYPSKIEELFRNAIETIESFTQFSCCDDAFKYKAKIKDIKYENFEKKGKVYSVVNNMSLLLFYTDGVNIKELKVEVGLIIISIDSIRMEKWNPNDTVVKKIIKEIFIRVMFGGVERYD